MERSQGDSQASGGGGGGGGIGGPGGAGGSQNQFRPTRDQGTHISW